MRSHSQMLLLLALLSVQVAVHVSGQSPAEVPPQATITSGSEATQALDDIEQEAARTKANESTQFIRPRFPSQDEILSQMGPPIQPFATNLPALDAFYMMFPALGSLLRWGSVFPMGSLLGAVPDTLLQPTGAASKVVLVLADDAAAKTRVPRQDSPPAPANPLDWAANVGQMITNMQTNPLLPAPTFDPNLGAPLQNLLPLNGLPGLGLLGQAAPAPAAPADPPAAPAPVEDTPARAAAPSAFPGLPNLPSFDPAVVGQSITSMLSQAPPNLLSQVSLAQLPQLQQFAQFLPQIPGLSQAPVGQASDISEVRVRPEIPYVTGTPQMKIKTALEKEQESRRDQELYQEQDQERVPLLWFRLPVGQGRDTQGKPIEDLRVEAKLKAFERQVITELKMLQQIERMAKEMRTSATTGTAAQSSDYRVNYPLNHTPVHKITRADIEQALRDDYVRRLVQKEAQRRGFINRKTGGFKRQTFTEDKNLSKEDIVQIMAYAYRMANEQMAEAEKSKQDKVYAAYRSPAERQWSEDQAKNQPIQQQRQMIQQNPMMMPQQRQMGEIPQAPPVLGEQQRQWSERQANQQMIQQNQMIHQNQMIQQSPMMMQQRQWTEEQAKQQAIQQNTMMMQQQRQWTEEQAKIQQERQWTEDQAKQQAIQQNAAMMQQRQWTEDQAKQQQEAMMQQQRQWTEEQARQQAIPHQQAVIQQGPMMMQRQWTEEEAKALQDQQTMQQRQMSDERQWADEKAKAQQQQAIQMGQAPIQMDQAPILQQMHQPMMQQRMEQLLTHNPPTNIGHPEEDDEDATMLGEAGPQMPENEGTARHKVDPLGLGGNKRKKSKSRRPAVVNYYYPAPQPQYQVPQYQVPQYQVPQYQAPSYGTSYGGGGYGSNAYGSGGYAANSYQRAAVGNDEVDDMLRRHQTLARTIATASQEEKEQEQEQKTTTTSSTTTSTTTTVAPPPLEEQPLSEQRIHKSPSSAPPSDIAVAPPSDPNSEPVLGSVFEFNEGLLHPFMGLLPVERPDDPWRRKPYDPHRPLYSGGGSYAAYLKDGRRRRDTHIMGQATPGLLTPGMLERLLRIKMEFQRRFPHLYKGMLSHHANQTRVEVKPPVLGSPSSPESLTKKIAPKKEEPIFELGAAERNLFEDEESDPLEDEPVPELEDEEEKEDKQEEQEKERDDNDIDYFNFGNDGDDY